MTHPCWVTLRRLSWRMLRSSFVRVRFRVSLLSCLLCSPPAGRGAPLWCRWALLGFGLGFEVRYPSPNSQFLRGHCQPREVAPVLVERPRSLLRRRSGGRGEGRGGFASSNPNPNPNIAGLGPGGAVHLRRGLYHYCRAPADLPHHHGGIAPARRSADRAQDACVIWLQHRVTPPQWHHLGHGVCHLARVRVYLSPDCTEELVYRNCGRRNPSTTCSP